MEAAPILDGPFGRSRLAPVRAADSHALQVRLYTGSPEALLRGGTGLVVTPNLDHLRMLARSAAFRRAYASADVIVNDSRFLDKLALRGRALCLPGSELAPAMLEEMGAGSRVMLIGGDGAMLAHLVDAYPRLTFTAITPSMGYIRRREERRQIVRTVMEAGADVIFVCTGAPQSELLAAQIKRAGCDATMVCCGSAFHFLSGAQQRAPGVMRGLGAEWLWRFLREGRTRKRYAADAAFLLARLPAFLALRRRGTAAFGAFELKTR